MIIAPTTPPTILLTEGELLPGFLNIVGTVVLRLSADSRRVRIIKNTTEILPLEFIAVPQISVDTATEDVVDSPNS